MADNVNEQVPTSSVETTDRGLFDFMKKKEDHKPQEETIATEFDQKVQVSEPELKKEQEEEEEKKHGGLLEKLHRSDSSSSSSSDEERDDEEKKRKKEKKEKKGLKEKLKEKLGGQHKDEEDTNVPIEKEKPHVQEVVYSEPSYPQEDHEKKGFIDKIKDKLPGQKKVDEQHDSTSPVAVESCSDDKKGFLDKIKEKIPGFSSKGSEEKKEHEEKKEGH